MNSCVVKDCRSNGTAVDSKITFHLFPSNSIIYNEWVSAVRKSRGDAWRPTATSAVCSLHFYENEMYVNRHGIRCVLSSGYPKKNLKTDNAVASSPQPANTAAQSDSRSVDAVNDLFPEEADEPPVVADVTPPNPICVSRAESAALQESWTMERLEAFSKEYLKHPVLHTSSHDGYVFRRYQQRALDELAKSVGEPNNDKFKASCLAFRRKLSELIHSLVRANVKEGIDPGRCLRDAPPAAAALAARLGLLRDALQKEFSGVNKTARKMHWVGVAICSAMYKAAYKYCSIRRDLKVSKVPFRALRDSLATILPLTSLKVLTYHVTSALWARTCAWQRARLRALSAAGDRARLLPRRLRPPPAPPAPAAAAPAAWRPLDLLLAHDDRPVDLLAMHSVEAVRALTVLVTLVRCGSPLRLAAVARARRRHWASVHRAYLRTGRIASVLLLQHRFVQLCALAAPHAPRGPHEPHGPQTDRPPHPLLQVIIDDGFVSKENNYWSYMECEGNDGTEEDAECLEVEAKEAQEMFDKVAEDLTEIEKCENITALKKFIRNNLLKEKKDNCGAKPAAETIAGYFRCYTNRRKAQPNENSNTHHNMDVDGNDVIDLDCDESKVNNNNNNNEDIDSNVIDLEEDSDMELDSNERITTDSKPKTHQAQKPKTFVEELTARRKDSRQSSIDERRFSSTQFDESSDDFSSESDDEPLINFRSQIKLKPELNGLSQRFLRNPINQCLLSICKPAVVRLQRADIGVRRVVKKVELPDIDEVRRINRTILTAEVAPIASRKTTNASASQRPWRCDQNTAAGLVSELRLLQASIRRIVGTHAAAIDTLVNAMTVDYFDSIKNEAIVHQTAPERERAKNAPKTKMTVDYLNFKIDKEIVHQKAPVRERLKNTPKVKTYEAKFKHNKLPRSELTITEKVKSQVPKNVQIQIKPVLSMTVTETPQIFSLRNEPIKSMRKAFNNSNTSNVAVTAEQQTTSLQETEMGANDATDLDDLLSCTIIRKPGDDRSVETDEQTQPYLVSQEEKLMVDSEAMPLITNVCSLATDGAVTNSVRSSVDNIASIDGAVNNKERSGITTPGVLNAVPNAGNPHLILNPKGDGTFDIQMAGNLFKVVNIWSVPATDEEKRSPKKISKVCKSTRNLKTTNQNSTMFARPVAVSSLPPDPLVVTPPRPPPLASLSNMATMRTTVPTTFNQPEVDFPESVMKMNYIEPKVLEPRPPNMKNLSMANPQKAVYHTCPVRWVNPDKPQIPSLLFPDNFTTLEAYGERAKGSTYSIIRLDSAKPLWTIAEEYLIVTEKFLPCTDPTYWTLEVRNRQLLMPIQNETNTFIGVIDRKILGEVKDSTEHVIIPETTVPKTMSPEEIVPDFVCKDTVKSGNQDTLIEDTNNDVKVKIEDQTSIVIENVCGSYVEGETKPNDVGDKGEKSSEVIDLDPAIVSKPKLKVKSFADYNKVEEKHRNSNNTKPEVLEKFGRHFRKLTDNPLRYAVVFTVVSSTKELDQLFRSRARLHLLPYLAGRLFPLDVSDISIPPYVKTDSPSLVPERAVVNVLPQPPKLTLMPNMTQPNMFRPSNLNLISNMTQPNLLQQSNLPLIPNKDLPSLTKAPHWTLAPQIIRTPMVPQNPVFTPPVAQLPSEQKTGLLVRHHDTRLLQDLAFKLQDFNKSEIKPEENQIYVFAPLDQILLTQS